MSKKQLKIIFLGGIDEIGKNMTAIEYGDNIIIVDAGIAFPSESMLGVDLIIPDMTYLVENKEKIRGIIITHGHEDHIGAIPYLIRCLTDINLNIYGSKLSLALIEHKIREAKLDMPKFISVEGGKRENISCFTVEFIRMCHSISGAFALSIETPLGTIFHTGDFKIDYTPVDNQVMDLARISEIGKKGVLLMLGESTNADTPGTTMSEKTVGKSIDAICAENLSRRIIIATFASNIHRLQQLFDIAEKYNRKVCVVGRSMINNIEMALTLGEINFNKSILIPPESINKTPPERLMIIATGSQGEPASALNRMARGELNKIIIGEKDTVILSSSPIPGNERSIYNIINMFYSVGADVIYNEIRAVHASGHACADELKLMLSLVKPTYFIPIHGETRHLRLHAKLAESMGIKSSNILLPTLGGVYDIKKSGISLKGKVTAGNMFVDGLTVDDMSSVVLNDRRQLAEEGFVIVLAKIRLDSGELDCDPEIISRGAILESHIDELKRTVRNAVSNGNNKTGYNKEAIQQDIKKALRRILSNKIKQYPMIMPILIEY